MKLFIRIKYDGTAYSGYQVQKNAPTVQQKLNEAARDLFGFECDITGCSRTDSGVHALDFCATVEKHGECGIETSIPLVKLPMAFNVRLPCDIAVYHACFVPDDFHARYSVTAKTYTYRILNSSHRDPFSRNTALHYPKLIDSEMVEKMNIAASFICGKHDFTSFMAAGSSVVDTVRTVSSCTVIRDGEYVLISITSDGFLYNMVRIICGTLLDVARGKIDPREVKNILSAKDRSRAGSTLSANGLYLTRVDYPDKYNLQ